MKRFPDFEWPEAYRGLKAQGLLSIPKEYDPSKLRSHLYLGDMAWLRPETIDSFEPEPGQSDRILPFARNAASDWWAFYIDPEFDPPPVVLCLHDDSIAYFYAPTFEAALFRQILQAVSSQMAPLADSLDDLEAFEVISIQLEQYRTIFPPWFPKEWINVIDRLRTLPLKIHLPFPNKPHIQDIVLIHREEADAIWHQLVPWPMADEKFEWQPWGPDAP